MSSTRIPPRGPRSGPGGHGGPPGPSGRPSQPVGPSLVRRFLDGDLRYQRGSIDRRMRALRLAFALLIGLFAVRLLLVQVVDTSAMAQKAENARLDQSVLTAPRGTIYDVRGVPLAQSVEARNLAVDQTMITDPAALAAQLAPILRIPADKLQQSMTGTHRFAYIARDVSPAVAQQVLDLNNPAIGAESTMRRDYPGGNLGTSVLGFVGTDGHGLAGLEAGMEQTLAGTDGSRSVEVTDGKLIATAPDQQTEPVPGTSVRLTIDRDLEFIAQQAIAAQVKASNAQSGSVVLMEAKTGRILAMASVPTVDPTNVSNAKPQDIRNRAVEEAFEPGSTAKVMTLSAAINEHKATPSTVFTIHDSIYRGTRIFKDHDPHPTFDWTLAGILAKSSNTGAIATAELVGKDKFYDYLKRFGLGQPTGTDFPGEASGYVPPISTWSESTFPTMAFGQGFSVSTLQMASVFQTIANDGVRVTPRIVESTVDADGKETPQPPSEAEKVVEPETAREVRKMMEGVISDVGTAKNASIPGYRVAGKTGTANRPDETCHCYKGYTASFIGIVPADDPQLVAAVVVQDPKGQYMGSDNGAPVFRAVMTAALSSLGIPPTGAEEDLLPISADELPAGVDRRPVNPNEKQAPFVSTPDTPQ